MIRERDDKMAFNTYTYLLETICIKAYVNLDKLQAAVFLYFF